MTEPNTLDEQIRELIRYRVSEEYKKYHNDFTTEWNGKDFWLEQIVWKLSETIQELFTEHSKQAFLLGYEAGESIANGIAKTMTWEEAKAQLKRNKGEDNE